MDIKEIKHLFLAYRNGIIADTLRQAGYPQPIIFGLQLPQLGEIARQVLADPATERETLARELWADHKVRESRLLACWLFDPVTLTSEEAEALAADVRTLEEADILVFRLLRHYPVADTLRLPPQVSKALARFK